MLCGRGTQEGIIKGFADQTVQGQHICGDMLPKTMKEANARAKDLHKTHMEALTQKRVDAKEQAASDRELVCDNMKKVFDSGGSDEDRVEAAQELQNLKPEKI